MNICGLNEDAESGYVYTDGFGVSSNIELISLDVPKGDMENIHEGVYSIRSVCSCFNFLASRIADGYEVLPGQVVDHNRITYLIVGLDDDMNSALLGKTKHKHQSFDFTYHNLCILHYNHNFSSTEYYANQCSRGVKLLLVQPLDTFPFTLPSCLTLHKWKEPLSLLKLALSNSFLNSNGGVGTTRDQWGVDDAPRAIIPNVLPFLSGVEIGESAKGIVVGERELTIKSIRDKFRLQALPSLNEMQEIVFMQHMFVYNVFVSPGSMMRGNFIRFLNGNTDDIRPYNLAECTKYEALVHIDDWVTDWDCFITKEEAQFVRDNIETFKALYKPVTVSAR